MKPTATIKAVDLLALKEALEGMVSEMGHTTPHGPVGYLYFEVSREAMDNDGYIIGTESFVGRVKLLDREIFGILDMELPPLSICRWVAIPSSLEMIKIDHPEERDGYCPSDGELAWEELNSTLQAAIEKLPEWDFDPVSKSWWLAGQEFPWK